MFAVAHDKQAIVKDMETLVSTVGEEETGEFLCQILPFLCGGRRRATGAEWEAMFAVAHDKQAIVKDMETLVSTVGEEETGEFLCKILPFLCGGRRRATGADWEAMLAVAHDKRVLVKDMENLVSTVGEEETGEILCQI